MTCGLLFKYESLILCLARKLDTAYAYRYTYINVHIYTITMRGAVTVITLFTLFIRAERSRLEMLNNSSIKKRKEEANRESNLCKDFLNSIFIHDG